jgi:hypothetical protein
MPVLQRILAEIGIERPDGRPLYALRISEERHAELGKLLRFRVGSGQIIDSTAARFVLWAAEYIRAHFAGGQLAWEFVFQGLGLREDRNFAVALVERGLRWWGRKVRVSEAGVHLYLYSLMAQRGAAPSPAGTAGVVSARSQGAACGHRIRRHGYPRERRTPDCVAAGEVPAAIVPD